MGQEGITAAAAQGSALRERLCVRRRLCEPRHRRRPHHAASRHRGHAGASRRHRQGRHARRACAAHPRQGRMAHDAQTKATCQCHPRAAATRLSGAQRSREHLAVSATDLSRQPCVRVLHRHPRRLPRRLAKTSRRNRAHHLDRGSRLGHHRSALLKAGITSTYFEGQAEANPQAQRGYSRDHRPDCKQVCIALVVTFDGFPLGYEVFAGNTHDSQTLQTIVATMEARHGMLGRVWITDRGMASTANLAWLRGTGRRDIIGAPKSELKKFGSELARQDGWRVVHEGVEVKLTRHPETGETVILCRSADRRSKERAMHDKFSRRIEAALDRLTARIARSKKRLDPATVNRQIGRILQQNQRAAARFAITLEPDGGPAGLRLGVTCNASFDDWAVLSEGAYLLRSNIDDWSDQQLWKAYIQLTQAEAAFRIQKDQLNVRPIWHQREDRVQAHILVCFLAFVLWKSLEMWQQR